MNKYVEIKANEISNRASHQLLDKCKETQTPYIIIETARKYANVNWEHVSYASSFEKRLLQYQDYIKAHALKIYEQFAIAKVSTCKLTSRVIVFEGLSFDAARKAANQFYDFMDNFHKNACNGIFPSEEELSECTHKVESSDLAFA